MALGLVPPPGRDTHRHAATPRVKFLKAPVICRAINNDPSCTISFSSCISALAGSGNHSVVFPGGMGSLAGSGTAARRGHPGPGCWLLVSPCRDVKTGTIPARSRQGGQINDAGTWEPAGARNPSVRAGKYPECRKRLSQRDRGDREGLCWGQQRLFWAAGRGRGKAGWWGWSWAGEATPAGDRDRLSWRDRGDWWRPPWGDGCVWQWPPRQTERTKAPVPVGTEGTRGGRSGWTEVVGDAAPGADAGDRR